MARPRALFIKLDTQVTHMPQAAIVPLATTGNDGAMSMEQVQKLEALGEAPLPSDALPLADGTAAPGSSPDYSRGDHVHPGSAGPAPSDADPLPNGYVSPGTSSEYSRGDHVHPHDIGCCPSVQRNITSNYNANIGDLVECDSNGGPFTVTLPAIDGGTQSKSIWIWVKPAPGGGPSPNAVTIAAHPTNFIDLAPSVMLNIGAMQLVSNGDVTWLRMY